MTRSHLANLNPVQVLRPWGLKAWQAGRLFVSDTAHGLWDIGHRSAVLLCLCVLAMGAYVHAHPEVRLGLETQTMAWLKDREAARTPAVADAGMSASALQAALAEPNAIERATAVDPSQLNRQQAAVAWWLSRRYHVAPEPISRLVQEAWRVGQQARLDPTLILAVMAIESGFNPFAQSHVGAQGLMQVMTRIHDDKYAAFGGDRAAFDPVTNLRVGVQVLKECISHAGSVEGGLRYYVGAANLVDDGGYALKVLAEENNLHDVASGHSVAVNAPLNTALVQALEPPAQANPAITPASLPPEVASPSNAAAPQQTSSTNEPKGAGRLIPAATPASAGGTEVATAISVY